MNVQMTRLWTERLVDRQRRAVSHSPMMDPHPRRSCGVCVGGENLISSRESIQGRSPCQCGSLGARKWDKNRRLRETLREHMHDHEA